MIDSWLTPLALEVGSVTADNAANIAKALNESNIKRIPCMAHCLNMVVKAWLSKHSNAVIEALKTARSICNHFRHSATKKGKLAEVQRCHNLPEHQLLQDVATRWNSTFYMLERLYEQCCAANELFED